MKTNPEVAKNLAAKSRNRPPCRCVRIVPQCCMPKRSNKGRKGAWNILVSCASLSSIPTAVYQHVTTAFASQDFNESVVSFISSRTIT